MRSVAPELFTVTIAPGVSSAVYVSVNLYGEAGAEFTNLSANSGTEEPGMTFNTQWAHSDSDGDNVGLEVGYNFSLGLFLMTLGDKSTCLNPENGGEDHAIVTGDDVELPPDRYSTLFGERYYSPGSVSSGVDDCVEASAGLRINVLPSLSAEAGYRYIGMAGKDDNRDNALADGVYTGVNSRS